MPAPRPRAGARRVNKLGETFDQTVARVHAQYPSTNEHRDWWYERLAGPAWRARPDRVTDVDVDFQLLGAILHDVLNVDLILESGTVRRGSRPPLDYIEGMAKLRQLRGHDFTTRPFAAAFRELAGVRSIRHLARLTGLSSTTVSRLIHGEIAPTGEEMEKVAKGFLKHGSYFHEYRIAIVCALTARLLDDNPERSIAVVRKLTRVT